MRIIGIDPGSRKTGFGVIDVSDNGQQLKHVAHGVLRLNVDEDITSRVRELAFRLRQILLDFKPDKCALEDIFVSENLRSALILGQARGAVLATMGLQDIPVLNFAPTKVKLALTGAGRSTKMQVSEIVRLVLRIDEKPAEDAGDALAIAICCAHHGQTLTKPVAVKKGRAALAQLARKQGIIVPGETRC